MDSKESTFREPRITPSVLASIPDCLYNMIRENIERAAEKRTSILVSSNTLANRFILERWGIRSSQRRRYKNLFSKIRQQCRAIFRNYLARGKLVWREQNEEVVFGVFKFDEVRGNLILGFVSAFGYLDLRKISDDM
ncbi:MAG: hypothetical protein AM325_014790 [Candidatus Thorarchaeota archaeon SMTZ1-45]|nr:MAG: hypothetical protein AM325_16205 [Candidatus Thorarchaeota archaeon SMTZ1-45]